MPAKGQRRVYTQETFLRCVEQTGSCWLWTRLLWPTGYGRAWHNYKAYKAHRLAWELFVGPIPEHDSYHGMCVLHKCDVRACVNPDHLFLGTANDNMQDKVKKSRQSKGPEHRKKIREVSPKGSQCHNALLHEDDVREILKRESTMQELAARFGVSVSTINNIWRGVSWVHVK